jgi:hypothetical protein
MKLVTQITCYSCVAACVESVLAEREINITQQELFAKYPFEFNAYSDVQRFGECLKMEFLITVFNKELKSEFLYNFSEDFTELKDIISKKSVIVFITTETPKHCRAYIKHDDMAVMTMDPWKQAQEVTIQYKELELKGGKIIYFTKKD